MKYTKQDTQELLEWAKHEVGEWQEFIRRLNSQTTTLELTYAEQDVIKDCLKYCKHRYTNHKESGARFLNYKIIKKLLDKI
jgi:hypothetical protein